MNKKSILGSLAMTALLAGTPAALTSCNDDDVNTIVQIIDALLTTDDLNNTVWADYRTTADGSPYIALMIGFANGQVELYEDSYVDKDGTAILQSGSYTLDTNNSTLTLTLNTGTRRYSIKEFTKGVSMTLTYNGRTITLKPYTES